MQQTSSIFQFKPNVALIGKYSGNFVKKAEAFEDSPECEDWLESGGRDEDHSYYYNMWDRRVNSR